MSEDPKAEKIREINARFKKMLDEHCPPGVGFVVIAFETPLSLRRPQVALATDHDLATVERLLAGMLEGIQKRSALIF